MTVKGIGRTAREVFLTFGALLGVLCIVATIAGVAFGVKPLVFRSGSMSPAINTGDLAVSRTVDASSLKTGDIVSVVNSEGNRVTHRLVNIASQGNTRQLTLKGDDNQVADAEVYTVTKAERVLFDIPKAGYVVNAAASPYGIFALGVYVTAMLLLVFRRKRPEDDADGDVPPPGRRRQGGARKADRKSSRVTRRTIATTAFAAALGIASPASAHWTNDVVIGGGTFTAYEVPKPVWVSCTVSGVLAKTVTVVWQEVSTPYALDYSAVVGSTPLTVTDNGSTRQVAVTSGLLGIGTFNVHITAQLPAPNGAWVSTQLTQPITFVTSLIAGCGTHS